jgi:glutathione synthase/RimK-type ligase-like ATP-grasp enzyme
MKVLVVTQSENTAVTPVIQALQDRGAEVFRFDTDLYPTAYRLSVWQGAGGPRSVLEGRDYTLDLHELGAIWYETVEAAYELPAMEPDVRAVVVRESTAVVDGLGSTLDAFQLDPVPNRDRAYSKLRQHRLATEVGLEIPRTLVTNDAAAVRTFFRDCPGRIITKMHKRFVRIVGVEGEQVTTEQVTATPVTAEDLDSLEGLHLCPMIFQEEVPKKVELRVMIVGNQVFTAQLDSQAQPATRYSWQNDQYANQWQPSELPERIAAQLRALLTRLGLNYSACDLIRTPDDRYVFLELNARGKYVLVEERTGLKVSEAIADLLLARVPRRV